jgi:hypothetical protein
MRRKLGPDTDFRRSLQEIRCLSLLATEAVINSVFRI